MSRTRGIREILCEQLFAMTNFPLKKNLFLLLRTKRVKKMSEIYFDGSPFFVQQYENIYWINCEREIHRQDNFRLLSSKDSFCR